jgi:hypothetical protein
MAYVQYLKCNGENLPLPTAYEVSLRAVEADTTGETEAGTIQRDVIREGIVTIRASFSVSPAWLSKLTLYSKMDKLAVCYFDTGALETIETEMYIDDFKATLAKDTSFKGLWNVSFTLNEF